MTHDHATVSTLNRLIEVCRDGQQGFNTASEGIRDSELKTLFAQYSQQRRTFAAELEKEVKRLGGDVTNRGTVTGALHHGWNNIKTAVTGKDDGAIISEAERGEDIAKAAYQKALGTTLPAGIMSVVQRQSAQVKETHDRIRALEKATQAR